MCVYITFSMHSCVNIQYGFSIFVTVNQNIYKKDISCQYNCAVVLLFNGVIFTVPFFKIQELILNFIKSLYEKLLHTFGAFGTRVISVDFYYDFHDN